MICNFPPNTTCDKRHIAEGLDVLCYSLQDVKGYSPEKGNLLVRVGRKALDLDFNPTEKEVQPCDRCTRLSLFREH